VRDEAIERVLRRERAITLAGLAVLAGLAWLSLLRASRVTADMAAMGMAQTSPWAATDALLAASMWAVMMVAMMVPSAAPMVLVFVAVNRRRGGLRYLDTGVFVLGYLAAWTLVSLAAAAAEWGLNRAALLSDDLRAATPLLGGALLIAAGVYQLTPLKHACLSRCQTPVGFLLSEWREGRRGAVVMGARHGLFCVGCCWVLMALLFVGGVMNLAWVAAIAGFVLLEKLVAAGRLVSWSAGGALIGWGGFVLLRGLSG
jgi:predicted metal-binding membrane protein